MTQYSGSNPPPLTPTNVDINTTAVVTPTDRLRWGAVWGGFVTALTSWILLTVLGAAIGLSVFDRTDNARTISMGAGIWAAVSALLAFLFGGWMAGRTAATQGTRNGLINGFMVWALAIPVLLVLLGSGLGHYLMRTSDGAPIRASVYAPDEMARSSEPSATLSRDTQRTATAGAWWTFGWLVLGLLAAAGGGLLGTQTARDYRYSQRTTSPGGTISDS